MLNSSTWEKVRGPQFQVSQANKQKLQCAISEVENEALTQSKLLTHPVQPSVTKGYSKWLRTTTVLMSSLASNIIFLSVSYSTPPHPQKAFKEWVTQSDMILKKLGKDLHGWTRLPLKYNWSVHHKSLKLSKSGCYPSPSKELRSLCSLLEVGLELDGAQCGKWGEAIPC